MFYKTWFPPVILGIITFICYVFFTPFLPLTDPVETNYALTAKEMLNQNNWMSPMIYGNYWYDKPIFTYWMLMLSYKLFGINNFAARLPSVLASTASVVSMYYIVCLLKKNKTLAMISAILLATMLEFWYIGHAVVTDGFLFLFSLGTFGFAYKGLTEQSQSCMMKAYACTALAVLTKGPVGIVLPGLCFIIFTILLYRKEKKRNPFITSRPFIKTLFSPIGILTFLLIASPWYIGMYAIHGDAFISGFLGLQNVGRALVSEHPKFNVWYYYIILTPVLLLPWFLALIFQLRHAHWIQPFNQFCLIWFSLIFIFFSAVATKYVTYTFLAIIPCVIVTAEGIHHLIRQNDKLRLGLYVTAPIHLLFFVFLIASFLEQSITPMYLSIAYVLSLLLWIPIYTKKNFFNGKSMFYTSIVTLMLMYGAVAITAPPVLANASAIPFLSYINRSNHQTYIFGTYFTSIVFYSDEMPVYVTISNTDDPRWTAGKSVMPHINKEEFINTITTETRKSLIIVPKKYYEEFKATPVGNLVTEIEFVNGNYILQTR